MCERNPFIMPCDELYSDEYNVFCDYPEGPQPRMWFVEDKQTMLIFQLAFQNLHICRATCPLTDIKVRAALHFIKDHCSHLKVHPWALLQVLKRWCTGAVHTYLENAMADGTDFESIWVTVQSLDFV